MSGSGISRRDSNRKIRQEALREQLSKQKHVEKVVENIKKLSDLDIELDALKVTRLRAANEGHLKLINKYLPDGKMLEIVAEVTNLITEYTDKELKDEIHRLNEQLSEQRPTTH